MGLVNRYCESRRNKLKQMFPSAPEYHINNNMKFNIVHFCNFFAREFTLVVNFSYFYDLRITKYSFWMIFTPCSGRPCFELSGVYLVLPVCHIFKIFYSVVISTKVFVINKISSWGLSQKSKGNQLMNRYLFWDSVFVKSNKWITVASIYRLKDSSGPFALFTRDPMPYHPIKTFYLACIACLVKTLISGYIFPNFFHGETSKANAPYWFGSRQRSNQCGAHCSLYQAVKSWRDLWILYHRPVTSNVTYPEVAPLSPVPYHGLVREWSTDMVQVGNLN